LHWAAEYGHKAVAEFLLANKAEIDAKSNIGNTPKTV
jgi:ankyrin repeat protein